MIGWGTIVYGAALSALFAAVVLRLGLRERRAAMLAVAGAAGFVAFLVDIYLY